LLLFPFLAFSAEKTGNDKELEQIFTLEREFYIEPFRNPAYDRTGKIEKAAAKFAKKKKDSAAKFRAKALLSAIYRSEEKFDKAVEIVADCADFNKISSNSAFPFKSLLFGMFLGACACQSGKLRGNFLKCPERDKCLGTGVQRRSLWHVALSPRRAASASAGH